MRGPPAAARRAGRCHALGSRGTLGKLENSFVGIDMSNMCRIYVYTRGTPSHPIFTGIFHWFSILNHLFLRIESLLLGFEHVFNHLHFWEHKWMELINDSWYPSHHPNFNVILHEVNYLAIGVPPFQETSIGAEFKTPLGWWSVGGLYCPIYSGLFHKPNRGIPKNQPGFNGMREGFCFHCWYWDSMGFTIWHHYLLC